MNERSDERRLSTADMAGRSPREPEDDRGVVPAHEKMERDRAQGDHPAPLFQSDEAGDVQTRWQNIQASFVDEPRRAVEAADELVADLMRRLADSFARERSQLEHQWDRDGDVSTEDLRIAFQRYRSFFDRLLSV